MIVERPTDYSALELGSSNLLAHWDAQRALGHYPEAAQAVLQAGQQRLTMGGIADATGNHVQAASDWLSAADCFVQAGILDQAENALLLAQELNRRGLVPAKRRDIHVALAERERAVAALRLKLEQVQQWLYTELAGSGRSPEEKRSWVLAQVKEVPAFHHLHQALRDLTHTAGQLDLAQRHNEWGLQFLKENLAFQEMEVWSRGQKFLEEGQIAQVQTITRSFLKLHPQVALPCILLAVSLWFPKNNPAPSVVEALEVLRPLIDPNQPDLRVRAVALALSALFHAELQHDTDMVRLLNEVDVLASASGNPWIIRVAADFRTALTRPHYGASAGSVDPDKQRLLKTAFAVLAA